MTFVRTWSATWIWAKIQVPLYAKKTFSICCLLLRGQISCLVSSSVNSFCDCSTPQRWSNQQGSGVSLAPARQTDVLLCHGWTRGDLQLRYLLLKQVPYCTLQRKVKASTSSWHHMNSCSMKSYIKDYNQRLTLPSCASMQHREQNVVLWGKPEGVYRCTS